MIVRRAGAADVAVLAELRGVDGDKLSAYADWVAAHAETHLPFVAELDGHVRRAVDFYLRNGFSHHRQILLWELAAS
ncbi:hypothetical protein [Micromonospora sp. NPDC049799]|uniref:hypothetical protein n=1 Tax=Micromonospora sp. NPDC049799 TaxID=3154741 RepID=UPI003411EABC